MFDKLDHLETKYKELTDALSSPEVMADSSKYQKTAKAHAEISELYEKYREYKDLKQGIAESKEMVASETDAELKEYAQQELAQLEERLPRLEEELKLLLVPKDPND
ncbi:MAG TPA: PCRF domain-containing protein, partial [Terriglobales bacterium]|nr:PCRF domain-containing protein [Terriglobales bacterium]